MLCLGLSDSQHLSFWVTASLSRSQVRVTEAGGAPAGYRSLSPVRLQGSAAPRPPHFALQVHGLPAAVQAHPSPHPHEGLLAATFFSGGQHVQAYNMERGRPASLGAASHTLCLQGQPRTPTCLPATAGVPAVAPILANGARHRRLAVLGWGDCGGGRLRAFRLAPSSPACGAFEPVAATVGKAKAAPTAPKDHLYCTLPPESRPSALPHSPCPPKPHRRPAQAPSPHPNPAAAHLAGEKIGALC